eukprot:CAMPEP_0173357114 /NCGR_PEP_ID=MMETSP1144-20121109/18690_1 /TAXON_ID=483371 /ORGANISM="non described non described, Strain CCMP2298" /LENGTH=395 /DNA_ID=CAMNT_0014305997 /DNA_START=66 /DNA_END=1254 /DNA_ORIENTATION=-
MHAPLIALLLLACLTLNTNAEKLDKFTFQPPFDETDLDGTRLVGDASIWKVSGATVVNKNFIRLTPDRQSKKGAIWSRQALRVPDFSAILQFRISGQGKTFFGDGVALWITQHGYHVDGIVHGSTEHFVGLGVVFDTFKNTERLQSHRDVTVLINDGTKTYELMTEDVLGCSAKVRYHAERADFSVTQSSRAKVVVKGKSLQVLIDADNSGTWTPCVEVPDLGLPVDWTLKAYLGLSATTGALADNHDIISLKASDEVNKALEQLQTLDHHLEHELAAVQDHIKNLLGKMAAREDRAEDRIADLEGMVKKEVDGSLESRLTALESQMHGNVERKMSNIEDSLDRKMTRLESQAEGLGRQNAGSWKIPFLILALLLVLGGVGLYLFYEKMRKMHLL